MMKNVAILGVLLIVIIVSSFSQEPIVSLDGNVIHPSPTSAIFKKYMGEQPALATGGINITIPIYTIRVNGLDIPLSLRYNTGGIKVFDDPQPFGYGWALLPGLRITRTILGRPDELFEFIGEDSNLPMDYNLQRKSMLKSGYLRGNNPDRFDSQRDMFTLCLIDKVHSFILDKQDRRNYKFMTIGNSELKLSADMALNNIVVVDGKGVKYIFGTYYELTDNLYRTSWMLSRINLPNGESVEFVWSSMAHSTNRVKILSGDSFIDDLSLDHPSRIYSGYVIKSSESGMLEYVNPYSVQQHLRSIDFPGGSVHIAYSENPMIRRLEIRSKHGIVKFVDFSYGDGSVADNESYLLRSIHLSDEGTYQFDYNPQRFGAWRLDYWGYFNNKRYEGEPSLTPRMKIKCHDSNRFIEVGSADRSIDAEMMQANMLTSVTYPTGGKTTYEYEPHRFNAVEQACNVDIDPQYNKPLTEGGGLRITKITTTDGDPNSVPIVKRYVYGKKEDGLAKCITAPTPETFVNKYRVIDLDYSEAGYPKPEYSYDMVNINNHSDYMDYNIGQTPIWYEEVAEYSYSGENESAGKIVYKFNDHIAPNLMSVDENWNTTIASMHKVFAKGSLMTAKEVYGVKSGKYKLVNKTQWNYKVISRPHVGSCYSSLITRNICSMMNNYDSPDFDENGKACVDVSVGDPLIPTRRQCVSANRNDVYNVFRYDINFFTEQLVSQTETHYRENGECTISETYSYLPDSEIISEKTINSSDGSVERLKLYYPQTASLLSKRIADYSSQSMVFGKMIADNVLSEPVYTVLSHNGDSISVQNVVGHYGNKLYLPSKILQSRGDSQSACLGIYDYDRSGNMRSRTSTDGIKETFLWGYNGMYPIVHLPGYDFSEVKKIIGDKTDFYDFPENGTSALDDIRSAMPLNSIMSTYLYLPLVGLSQETDPANVEKNYGYNMENRLTNFSIRGKGIIQKFTYNMFDKNFTAELRCRDSYNIGDYVNMDCDTQNSSGDVSYEWSLTNSEGKNINIEDNSQSMINLKINDVGIITAVCKASDVLKGESVTRSKSFNVIPESINFEIVSSDESSGYLLATMKCLNPITIKFKVMVSIDEGTCLLEVGQTRFNLKAGDGDFTFSESFAPGTHNAAISFGDNGNGNIVMYPLEISGTKSESIGNCTLSIDKR